MASHRIIARGLTIAFIGSTLLVAAACSRPTPVGSGGDTTPEAGETGGEATQSSPYDVTSPPPADLGGYPPPPSVTPVTPAAYLAPGEGGAEATEAPAAEPTQTP